VVVACCDEDDAALVVVWLGGHGAEGTGRRAWIVVCRSIVGVFWRPWSAHFWDSDNGLLTKSGLSLLDRGPVVFCSTKSDLSLGLNGRLADGLTSAAVINTTSQRLHNDTHLVSNDAHHKVASDLDRRDLEALYWTLHHRLSVHSMPRPSCLAELCC
jgi:hypothetical protein